MCDEVGFIPDSKIPQMWVHWDLKPCCVLIVSVALAVSTPVSLQTYGDLCECDITYFTLISLYRLILFSWGPLDKARFSSFLQYFCYSQSKHGNLIIPEGEWKQASIDILVSKTKDRRKTRSERSWRSARLSPDGRQLWTCAGLSSCPAGSYGLYKTSLFNSFRLLLTPRNGPWMGYATKSNGDCVKTRLPHW